MRIEVRDNGTGMSQRVRRRIFDPFFTTKEPGHGTGLGMFFCHEVVTAAGGTIEVTSTPGSGTLVTIALPELKRTDSGRVVPRPRPRTARRRSDSASW